MNPWKTPLLTKAKDFIRAMLWLCMVVNALLAAVFTIWFAGHFFWNLRGWCLRVLFQSPW